MKVFFHLILALAATLTVNLALLGCTQNKNNLPAAQNPPENNKAPVDNKPPEILLEDPEVTIWFYQESREENDPMADFNECQAPFTIGSLCSSKGDLCHVNNHLYLCSPQDLMVRIRGKVLDEKNEPVVNALVMGGLGFSGYTNLSESKTNERGEFVVKAQNMCLSVVNALKEGYAAPSGFIYSSALTGCRTENYTGAQDIIINMKKMARTVPANREFHGINSVEQCHLIGKVVDSTGQPAPGKSVAMTWPENKNPQPIVAPLITDQEGLYEGTLPYACPQVCYIKGNHSRREFRTKASCETGHPADLLK